MEEVAISDAMGGDTSKGYRRFGDKCTGVPTKKMIMEFWGKSIMHLPAYGKEVHAKKGAFYIDSNLKKPLYVADCKHELGVVSYNGTGKYQDSTYIPYHDLPDCEDTATPEQRQRTSPDGQGWWPVLSLGIDYSAQGLCVLLVCFYQLQWVEKIIPVWKIWPTLTEAEIGNLYYGIPQAMPQAKAMPHAKPKAMPRSGASSSSWEPNGVWAEEDVEMDASASASASSAFDGVLRLRGATAVPTSVPPPPPPPPAEEEDDPNMEIDDVSED